MFMTWITLLAFATILSVMSLRHINILLSLGAMIGWFSLMAFNLANPLVGIVQGSAIHQWLTMGFIAIGIAIMLMYFRNRGKIASVIGGVAGGSSDSTPPAYERKGLMEMSEGEYKAIARKATHPNKRRR